MSGDLYAKAAIGPLRDSAYFLVIASESYVKSLEDPTDSEHMVILSQVLAARADHKPIIIFWMKGISGLSKTKLREVFKDMNVLGEHQASEDMPTEKDVKTVVELLKKGG